MITLYVFIIMVSLLWMFEFGYDTICCGCCAGMIWVIKFMLCWKLFFWFSFCTVLFQFWLQHIFFSIIFIWRFIWAEGNSGGAGAELKDTTHVDVDEQKCETKLRRGRIKFNVLSIFLTEREVGKCVAGRQPLLKVCTMVLQISFLFFSFLFFPPPFEIQPHFRAQYVLQFHYSFI